jgi:23S rRNA pseudouridine1911/1915/1917 synthase
MKRRSLRVGSSESGTVLEAFVSSKLDLEATVAGRLISQGSVYIQGKRCKNRDQVLRSEEQVMVVLSERGRSTLEPVSPQSPPVPVLFEDAALLAVNKPAGLDSQPSASRGGDNALDLIAARLRRRPGRVHRLDRETSGVLVFGKTSQAAGALSDQFRRGSALKRYLAVTASLLPESGTIDLPISKDPSRIGRYRATHAANGEPAVTHFRRLFASDQYSLVALYPQTGRTHQLRAHLAALGSPILGDVLYGAPSEFDQQLIGRTLLHAQALQLAHPTSAERLCLEAPLPEDLAAFFNRSGVSAPKGPWEASQIAS